MTGQTLVGTNELHQVAPTAKRALLEGNQYHLRFHNDIGGGRGGGPFMESYNHAIFVRFNHQKEKMFRVEKKNCISFSLF